MHIKRLLTGIIGVAVLICLIGAGWRLPFYIFLFLVAFIGLMEFYSIAGSTLPKFIRWSAYSLSLLLFISIARNQIMFTQAIIALWAIIPLAYCMLTYRSYDGSLTSDIGKALLGPVYVCIPLAMLVMIDRQPNGSLWIFFLLAVIFSNDTGAFYSGKIFGKHKLYEAVSPNKTWEGTIGGLISAFMIAFLFLVFLPIHELNTYVYILVFVLAILAQVGDLAESMLKRVHGIKDSGKILPGHGGMLDRIDGLLFSIPVLYIYLVWTI
jgi:phosphatidate cytidylyltransferase